VSIDLNYRGNLWNWGEGKDRKVGPRRAVQRSSIRAALILAFILAAIIDPRGIDHCCIHPCSNHRSSRQ
jgi:hypothetical protein